MEVIIILLQTCMTFLFRYFEAPDNNEPHWLSLDEQKTFFKISSQREFLGQPAFLWWSTCYASTKPVLTSLDQHSLSCHTKHCKSPFHFSTCGLPPPPHTVSGLHADHAFSAGVLRCAILSSTGSCCR